MVSLKDNLLSVVVPAYNEATGIAMFHKSLLDVLSQNDYTFELIYVNDGSTDETAELIEQFCKDDARVKLVSFSRNFGKEMALTAGIAQAKGAAIISLDADGQHPVELIPKFVAQWQKGTQVVVGVRDNANSASSRLFHKIFNGLSKQKLVVGSTDFRLIDREVQQAFLELPETDRMTRGLIDWLGFERSYLNFTAKPRFDGKPAYGRGKLVSLAVDSMVSMSPTPLYLFGGLGIFITLASLLLGGAVLIEQIILEDPLHWKFTGTASLSILILFFVGLILMSQGLLSLYVSHIHNQTKQRPLYVINYARSIGLNKVK